MAQKKKASVRDCILESARRELAQHGFAATTMRAIARRADVSTSNLYVYFPSKLDLLFAIYDPWLREQIDMLERRAAQINDPHARLRAIIATLWEDFPAADGAFGNTFVEGLAVSGREGSYSRSLLLWAEERISQLVASCLPEARAAHFGNTALAHILFMAFDGFAVNYMLVGPSRRLEHCIDLMTALLLGTGATQQGPGDVVVKAMSP